MLTTTATIVESGFHSADLFSPSSSIDSSDRLNFTVSTGGCRIKD